ncbi:MAG: creatininase family protein [bacterium]|nr:creatininase family protein [bacterium]
MRFGDLTWQEIEGFIKEEAVVILPLGCTEQQGPHMAVDWDNRFIGELCLQASEKAEKEYGILSLVLPTIPVGPASEHFHWPGYLHFSQSLHEQVVAEILASLKKQGFKTIIVWSGCGGHDLKKMIEKFNRKHEEVKVYYPQLDLYAVSFQMGGRKMVDNGGHADAPSTSWCLYLAPDYIRKDKIQNPNNRPLDWTRTSKDLSLYTKDGAFGNLTLANKDFGKRSWEQIIKEAAKVIKEIKEEEL